MTEDIDLEHNYLKRMEQERRWRDTEPLLTVAPLEKFKRVWFADSAVIPYSIDWNKRLGESEDRR